MSQASPELEVDVTGNQTRDFSPCTESSVIRTRGDSSSDGQRKRKSRLRAFHFRLPPGFSRAHLNTSSLSLPLPSDEAGHAGVAPTALAASAEAPVADLAPVSTVHVPIQATLMPPPPPAAQPTRRATLPASRRRRSRSIMRLDARYSLGHDTIGFPTFSSFSSSPKPLSPIEEQDYLSPDRTPIPLPSPLDLTDMDTATPSLRAQSLPLPPQDAECSDAICAARPSPFLTRSVKRTNSQTSRRSCISASPPSLPPLDLEPQFSPQPLLSTISGSASISSDDASSGRPLSWITAHSADADGLIQAPPDARLRPSFPLSLRRSYPTSDSSSFIDRKWDARVHLVSRSNSGLPYHHSGDIEKGNKKPWTSAQATRACVLFWIGFIAPWCWLIGGWMPSGDRTSPPPSIRTKKLGGDVTAGPILPMWWGKPQQTSKRQLFPNLGYPFRAPPPQDNASSESVGTRRTTPTIRIKPGWTTQCESDPWIRRCRIAAIASGTLLTAAFVAIMVVLWRTWP